MNKIFTTFLLTLMLGITPLMAQQGPDEAEPNDSVADADEITGFSVSGEVGRKTDKADWYFFNPGELEYLTITLTYDVQRSDIDLEIYDENENYLGELTSNASPDTGTIAVSGRIFFAVTAFEGNGPYTITIEAGEYEANDGCQGIDEIEPNDTEDTADYIEKEIIEGYICVDDYDWYLLSGIEGTYPIIRLLYDHETVDVDLDVWSDDTLVGSLTGLESPDSFEFEIPGECWLMVYSAGGEGEYRIEIEPRDNPALPRNPEDCQGADEVEPNDTEDDADFIEKPVWEGYLCEGDIDWYLLSGFEGNRPEFTLEYDDSQVDVDCDIWSDDELVGSLTATTSPDTDILKIPGECMIMVYAFSGEGWYRITIDP